MATCETRGNDHDRSFKVEMAGKSHVFDSFECAIHALAPACPACGVRVIGHGVQVERTVYCCAPCADHAGKSGLRDRA